MVVSLDDLQEEGGAVLHGLGEDLQQVAIVIKVHQDLQSLELGGVRSWREKKENAERIADHDLINKLVGRGQPNTDNLLSSEDTITAPPSPPPPSPPPSPSPTIFGVIQVTKGANRPGNKGHHTASL